MGLADDLISEAKTRAVAFTLPDEAREDLLRVLDHNDRSERLRRIPADKFLAGLEKHHGIKVSRETFDRYVVREFGRTFGGAQ